MKFSRLLFGEDIFISYSRADATAYAAGLANLLSAKGFACFLDQWGSEPGKAIPARVLRALKRSSMLVLVGSPRGAASEAVDREVAAFLATARPIVPISVNGALEQGRCFARIAGASISLESSAGLTDGKPAEQVLNRIESSFLFTKRNTRVRRAFIAAGIGLLVLIGIAAWRQQVAYRATKQAAAAEANAEQARAEAVKRAQEANEQAELARANAAEAKRQEAVATENAQRAMQQQQLAEERARRARSVELAAASRSLVDAEPDLAALLAIESFHITDTFEARQALLSTLSYRPALEAVLLGAQEGREIGKGQSDTGRITGAWFSTDGSRIAVRDWDENLSLWPASASVRARQSIAAGEGVRWAELSDDFRILVKSRWDDKTVHVQSLAREAPEIAFPYPHGELAEIAISGNGALIATGSSDGIVALWNGSTGALLGEPLTRSNRTLGEGTIALVSPVTVLRFTPDGKTLYWRTSQDNSGAIDVETRQPAIDLPADLPARMAFSADGADVAFIKNNGGLGAGRLYKGKLESPRELASEETINAVAIGADGTIIAGGNRSGTLFLYDRLASVSPAATIKAHTGPISALAFSPDGSRLVSGSDDRTVMLWRTRQGLLYETLDHPALEGNPLFDAGTVRFTHDGRRLLAVADDSILVVDPARAALDGPPIRCEGARLAGLALHPDGKTIAAGSSSSRFLFADLATRQCANREKNRLISANASGPTALVFSADGKQLAGGDNAGGLAVWKVGAQLRGEYLQEPNNDQQGIYSVAWTRDGKSLAVGGVGHRHLWRVDGTKGKVELDGNPRYSRRTALSPDGRLLAGSAGEGVHVWDLASGRALARFAIDKPSEDLDDDTVTALAFDGDARLLAVGQENGRLSLFDLREERWLADLPHTAGCFGTECAVLSVDFSPDGKRLAARVDKSILIWRLEPSVWVRRACELANRELTDTERRRYLRNDGVVHACARHS